MKPNLDSFIEEGILDGLIIDSPTRTSGTSGVPAHSFGVTHDRAPIWVPWDGLWQFLRYAKEHNFEDMYTNHVVHMSAFQLFSRDLAWWMMGTPSTTTPSSLSLENASHRIIRWDGHDDFLKQNLRQYLDLKTYVRIIGKNPNEIWTPQTEVEE